MASSEFILFKYTMISLNYYLLSFQYQITSTDKLLILNIHLKKTFFCVPEANVTTAVAQWVRALVPQAEGWVFKSQPRRT